MKKLIAALFLTIMASSLAHADSITANISGDNNISYWNGTSWTPAGNNWQQSESYTFNVNSQSNVAYIAVSNDYTTPNGGYDNGANPAGFAASFTDNTAGGTFKINGSNTLLSNTVNFQVLAVSPGWTINPVVFPNIPTASQYNPPSSLNPLLLSGYTAPTGYGTNTYGDSIWADDNGGTVGSIDPNAEWLWTANNDGSFASEDDYAIFEVNLGVTNGSGIGGLNNAAVPEPPTVLLFAFAIAMLILFNRKKALAIVTRRNS